MMIDSLNGVYLGGEEMQACYLGESKIYPTTVETVASVEVNDSDNSEWAYVNWALSNMGDEDYAEVYIGGVFYAVNCDADNMDRINYEDNCFSFADGNPSLGSINGQVPVELRVNLSAKAYAITHSTTAEMEAYLVAYPDAAVRSYYLQMVSINGPWLLYINYAALNLALTLTVSKINANENSL